MNAGLHYDLNRDSAPGLNGRRAGPWASRLEQAWITEERWAQLDMEMCAYMQDRGFRMRTWREGESRGYSFERAPVLMAGALEDGLRGVEMELEPPTCSSFRDVSAFTPFSASLLGSFLKPCGCDTRCCSAL